MNSRWFMTTDNDSHWFMVPVEHRAEWEAWTDLDSDDEASWTAPIWAYAIGGSPTLVTFTDPEVGG